MFDHVTIRVLRRAESERFYDTVLPTLGLAKTHSTDHYAEWGEFSLAEESETKPATRNLHIAFPGDDGAVRHFHDGAVAAGYRSNGGPGERARYHPGYCAAYVLDPDGNNIEVVNHHRP